MRIQKSEPLKGISIASVEETVDEAMAYIPENFDFSKPGNREAVRNWMVRVCSAVVQRNSDSMVKAAESAIKEAAALAVNPDYYATRRTQRDKRKVQRAIAQSQQMPKSRAQQQFERLDQTGVKM